MFGRKRWRRCSSCRWHGPRRKFTHWLGGYRCRNNDACFARYKLNLNDQLRRKLNGPDEVSVATVDGVELYVRRDVAEDREFADVLTSAVTWFRSQGAAQARRDGAFIVHIP
jgi:hypothetical protein